jgi:hypothetical protein
MTLAAGIAILCMEAVFIAGVSATAVGATIAVASAAVMLPLAAFVEASPLSRLLLACGSGAVLIRAADLKFAAPIAAFIGRLAHVCSYVDTRKIAWRSRSIDVQALQRLVASAGVLGAAIFAVKSLGTSGSELPMRWLAGGIGLFSCAEIAAACHELVTGFFGLNVPPPFDAPYKSKSLGEFWSIRWNLPASQVLRRYCFDPLKRRGATLALFVTFAVSALGHAGLADVALGRVAAVSCAIFFLLQPLLIDVERGLAIRHWKPAVRQIWTLAVLAVTSPLVVEPILRIVDKVWGGRQNILLPTLAVVGFWLILGLLTALAGLVYRRAVSFG